jgi:hypothetical protein
MSFTLRATMANIAFIALFLGGWVTSSGWYIAIATAVFFILILLTVASAILDTEHRPFWTGAAVVSCGVLLFSNHLPIFDAIAEMEHERRISAQYQVTPMISYLPVTATVTSLSSIPDIATVEPPSLSSTAPSPWPVISAPPIPLVTTPQSTWSFNLITSVDGFKNLLRAYLVCSAGYFAGLIGGLICAKLYARPVSETSPSASG